MANFISFTSMRLLRLKMIRNVLEKDLVIYLKKNKPDLVISVIGFINYTVAVATDELKIPFILIPTDLDQTYACNGLQNILFFQKRKKISGLKYAAAIDNFEINKTVPPFSIFKDQISYIGYPLRQQFFEEKNIEALKEKMKLPKDKLVITILKGKLGSSSIFNIVKSLSQIKRPIHLMVCVGTNLLLKKKLSKLNQTELFTQSIVEYTSLISDVMAVSDMIITKPGSTSIMEVFSLNKQLLIDATYSKKQLRIELFNCNFCLDNALGEVITDIADFEMILEKIILNKSMERKIKTENLINKNFSKNLKSLADSFFI